jgi:Amt family ammonium transporter
MVGGVAALVGAKILGPRIGKYSKSGKSRAIPGHNLTIGALGCFILWFCWYGFNACSTVSMTGDESMIMASNVFVTTTLSAAMAANAVMIFTWIRYKKPDVSMTLNGALGGLVAITAGCDAVSPVGAAIIGTVAGILMTLGIEFVDKVLKIDDPVGAVGVHGICGALGTILVGVFALDGGLLYGGGFSLLGVQTLGVLAVIAWVAVTMFIVFNVIKKTVGLRVSKEEEIVGLDIHEHALTSSYADFMPVPTVNGTSSTSAPEKKVSMDEAVPVTYKNGAVSGKMTNVAVITKQSRFEVLKEALDKLGVTGITVTQVLGYGMQKGNYEYYRGAPVDVTLLPKIKIEIVVCKIPVETLIDTIKKALFTGNIGDGKIFVYDVENVIKVRTGEEGYDALQDDDEELLIS